MDALEKMSLAELRGQLSMTPWFAAAHIELVRRVSAIGPGVGSEFEKAALNVWSRAALYRIVNEASGKRDFTDADITEAIRAGLNAGKEDNGTGEGHTAGQSENAAPRVIVLGGDYFSREDLDSLKAEDRIFSLLGRNAGTEGTAEEPEPASPDKPFDDMRFYTETLAAIYAEQGYFDKAKEVYGKLILLYPEKSAYFASLIEKLKQ